MRATAYMDMETKLEEVAWSGDEDLDTCADAIARYCRTASDLGELVEGLIDHFGPERVLDSLGELVGEYILDTM